MNNRRLLWNEPWLKDANCKGLDSAIFFPPDKDVEAVLNAKRICSACPVKRECLDYVLTLPVYDDAGIWGGTTPSERKRIRRRLRQEESYARRTRS